jgi:ATP synthase protein I
LAGPYAAMFHAPTRPVFFERGRTFRGRRMAMEEPDPKSPEDARLTSLNQRLKQAQLEEAARKGRPDIERSQQLVQSVGQRLLYDLVGLPFGGGLIGWLFDRWLGTAPWIMLAMLFLGFGLAIRNVMRVSRTGSNGPEGS